MSEAIDKQEIIDSIKDAICKIKEEYYELPDKTTQNCNPYYKSQYLLGKKHALLDLKSAIERGDYDVKAD